MGSKRVGYDRMSAQTHIVGSCCIAQKLGSVLCDELDGRMGVEWEGGSRGRGIYVYILADSLWCTVETNTTL